MSGSRPAVAAVAAPPGLLGLSADLPHTQFPLLTSRASRVTSAPSLRPRAAPRPSRQVRLPSLLSNLHGLWLQLAVQACVQCMTCACPTVNAAGVQADGGGGAAAEQPAAQPKPAAEPAAAAAAGAAGQGEGSKPIKRTPMRGAGSGKSPAGKSPASAKSGGEGGSKGGSGGKAGGSKAAAKPAAKRKAKQVIDDDSDWEEEKEEEQVGGGDPGGCCKLWRQRGERGGGDRRRRGVPRHTICMGMERLVGPIRTPATLASPQSSGRCRLRF